MKHPLSLSLSIYVSVCPSNSSAENIAAFSDVLIERRKRGEKYRIKIRAVNGEFNKPSEGKVVYLGGAVSLASRCECLYTWVAIDIQNHHLGVAAVVIWKQLSRFLVTLNAGNNVGGWGGRIILCRSGSEN